MNSLLLPLLLLSVIASSASSSSSTPASTYIPSNLRNTKLLLKFPSPPTTSKHQVKALTLNVPLDYNCLDHDPNQTSCIFFPIRYYIDDSNMKSFESPIFLQMGGEGSANTVTCNRDMIENNAICVQVEHRFYGASLPSLEDGGGSNLNLKIGLSVDSNLRDTAAVLEAVQDRYRPKGTVVSSNRPVVTYGGSYSGATCAWFRMAYPMHTDGCVSSSGVVNAIYEFNQFDALVNRALSTPDDQCNGRIRDIGRSIDEMFENGEGGSVKMMFNSSLEDDEDFVYMIADGFSMIEQYGGKAELCLALAAEPDESEPKMKIENLANVILNHFGDDFGSDCYYDTSCLKVENGESKPGLMGSQNSRSWRWQKCSELAYLQSKPSGNSGLRSSYLTLHSLERQCLKIFGEIPAKTGGNTAINERFGGDRIDSKGASNVFSVGFSDDPWFGASVTSHDLGSTLPLCVTTCDGCGHCGAGVSYEEGEGCTEQQGRFAKQIVDQARFQGTYLDPNHEGCERFIKVDVSGVSKDSVVLTGFDFNEEGEKVEWGPLPCGIDGLGIQVDFSRKGGPKDLKGEWDGRNGRIVWEDGNFWPKVEE